MREKLAKPVAVVLAASILAVPLAGCYGGDEPAQEPEKKAVEEDKTPPGE